VILTGGAARSKLWPQILADVLGLAIHVPDTTESAAAGAAALAGLAVGARSATAASAGPSPLAAPLAVPTPTARHDYEGLYAQWIRRMLAPGSKSPGTHNSERKPPHHGGCQPQ
jgi:autoinducer 2 (AI-2) kinase